MVDMQPTCEACPFISRDWNQRDKWAYMFEEDLQYVCTIGINRLAHLITGQFSVEPKDECKLTNEQVKDIIHSAGLHVGHLCEKGVENKEQVNEVYFEAMLAWYFARMLRLRMAKVVSTPDE